MTLVRMLRGGQITLPAEARRALKLSDGAYLDLQVTNETVASQPVEIIERTDADRQLDAILSRMQYIAPEPRPTEDEFTKTVEEYTASIPSSAYLGVAVGAMGLSLLCQMTGRGKWGNFIAQWVPTWLIIGLYNKVVKVEGHDRTDRGIA
jgi:bifunctional DNA-binding transcriptional regulator/antitoxin component of YhaV-PrlF toxin-antitoxin module